MEAVAAVDLGATSGRVIIGYIGHNELSVRPVARFPNGPVEKAGELHWDITRLYRAVLDGLAAALREEHDIRSIGVDSWAVDYALLRDGMRLGEVFHYRDERNGPAAAAVHEREDLRDRVAREFALPRGKRLLAEAIPATELALFDNLLCCQTIHPH